MFKKFKLISYAACITAALLIFSATSFAQNAQKTVTAVYNNIKIVVDGKKVIPVDVNGNVVDPFIIDGTTYLPVRALANALGETVAWNQETNTVIIGDSSASEVNKPVLLQDSTGKGIQTLTHTAFYNNIKISVHGNLITPTDVNGNIVEPFIIDGTTYLPVRALANALGEEVSWKQSTSTVFIGEQPFTVDSSVLKAFSDKTLITVGNINVKGAYYNICTVQNCDYQTLQQVCDNYSPDKNLQTLTVGSVPVAKSITDSVTKSVLSDFAIFEHANNAGFVSRSDIQQAMASHWAGFCSQYASESEYVGFLNECGITSQDCEFFVKMLHASKLFKDDIYNNYASKTYTDDEFISMCKEHYITAKHILVEDEETAKSIISSIESGASFDELAATHNTDPGATNAGYTFKKGEMVSEFEQASYALTENTYTKVPVKTDYGYHIIMRLPLDTSWLISNKEAVIQNIALSHLNNVVGEILSNIKVEFTDEYNNYISTIK